MRRRQGFTLVEMLVTLALVLFIMVILSEAFSAGLGTFRQLKAIGDMQEKLRSVATILRHDLQNHYVQNGATPPPAMSSLWLDNTQFGPPAQPPGSTTTFAPPTLGFFRIEQLDGTPPGGTATNYLPTGLPEGTDPQGLPSVRSAGTSTGSHRLYFTIRVPLNSNGQRRESYLAGNVPPSPPVGSNPADKLDSLGPSDYNYNPALSAPPTTYTHSGTGVYYSQSAEVAYFLRSLVPTLGLAGQTPGATQSNPSGTATPLFALYRRQLLLMDGTSTDSTNANTAPTPLIGAISNYQDISCRPQITTPPPPAPPSLNLAFNSLSDVASITANNNRCLTLSPLTFSTVPATQGGPYDSTATSPPNFPYPKLGNRGESASVQGDDLLLTNVVSFTVRVLPAGQYDFTDIQGLPGASATAPFVYDTALVTATAGYRISALEITIRVWDVKTQQTRQMTIIQDMGSSLSVLSPSVP